MNKDITINITRKEKCVIVFALFVYETEFRKTYEKENDISQKEKLGKKIDEIRELATKIDLN